MNYAFVDEADFDPAAIELPEILRQSKGPEQLIPPDLDAPLQMLQQQSAHESLRARQLPEPVNQQVSQNLRQQVQLSTSDARAAQLKPLIQQLKSLAPEMPAGQRREQLLTILEKLQACYRAEHVPKDLTTMSVLHPLLRCQALKWDQLKVGQPAAAPGPEAVYLHKLRQLKGGLGAVERAALFQLIVALNQQWVLLAPETEEQAPARQPEQPAQLASKPETLSAVALPADFDPLRASRLSLQLRAKLQRTYSAPEKQEIQAQLQQIEAQQQSFFAQRRAQALGKQAQEFEHEKLRFEQGKYSSSSFENWRKLRLTGLQNISRLFGQGGPPAAVATAYFESAQAQVARLGLDDAVSWIAAAQARLSPPDAESELTQLLQAWRQSFESLIQAALQEVQRLALQLQQLQYSKQLEQLEELKADWQKQLERLKQLEADYLAAPEQSRQHELLQAYAELLASLPEIPASG